jgi:hypothetical protein
VSRHVILRRVLAEGGAPVIARAAAVPVPLREALCRRPSTELPDERHLVGVQYARQDWTLRGHLADDASATRRAGFCQRSVCSASQKP